MGVKSPDIGTPDWVEGTLVRAEAVEVGVGLLIVGVGVNFSVGVGVSLIVGVAVKLPDGVAVKAGISLWPAAKTVKVLVKVLPR